MKKKYYLLSVVGVLIVVISFGLGYTYAYIHGLLRSMDMHIGTHSSILLTYSATLIQRLKTPDIVELVEAMEENGDSLSSVIITFKPLIEDPETRKLAEIALTQWEKAKERLQELSLKSKNTNDSADDP